MRKIRSFFALYWQAILSAVVVLAVVIGLLGFHLATLTPALSQSEVKFIASSLSINDIIANPVDGLMKLPIFALNYFDQLTIFTARAVAAVYGVLSIVLFYFVIRRWHTRRISLLAAFMFIVSSWFLQVSRIALPYILFTFGVILLIAVGTILHDKRNKLGLILTALCTGLLLYIPGMIWLILALLIWQLPNFRKILKDTSTTQRIGAVFLIILLVSPLAYAIFNDTGVALEWLAVPDEFIPLEWIRRLLVLPIFLTAQGPLQPVYNLGRLPLLDVFTTVMVVIGIYSYYFKAKLQRTVLLVMVSIVSALLIAFNGPDFLPLLLPIVFILAGAGITLLLQQWFTVFPRNPLARALGVMTIAVVIAFTGIYHIRRYFVAWSGNPDTRNEFIYLLDSE